MRLLRTGENKNTVRQKFTDKIMQYGNSQCEELCTELHVNYWKNMERTGIKAEESNPAGFHGYVQAISRWRDGERGKRVGQLKRTRTPCKSEMYFKCVQKSWRQLRMHKAQIWDFLILRRVPTTHMISVKVGFKYSSRNAPGMMETKQAAPFT